MSDADGKIPQLPTFKGRPAPPEYLPDLQACDICWAIITPGRLDEHRNRHSEVHSPWQHEPGLQIMTERGAYLLGVSMTGRDGITGRSNWRQEGYSADRAYRLAWDDLNRNRAAAAADNPQEA